MTRRTSRFLLTAAAAVCILGGMFLVVSLSCNGNQQKLPVADRPRAGGLDVTFLVAADTHLGYPDIEPANKTQIEAMNAIPGKAWPSEIGGKIATPRGVLIAGDLTDGGLESEWRQFAKLYGLTGRDALLKYPVYEGTGNHDRWPENSTFVTSRVRARHGSLYYSWNWGDLHLVCLDEAPTRECLRWLREDLAATGKKLPIVMYLHFPLAGTYSDSNWFGPSTQKSQFARLIRGFNVVGIFHGHYHATEHYQWQGFDVYNVGSPKHSARSFAVVRVTDGRLSVAEWDWNWWRNGWVWWHTKEINAPPKAAHPQTAPAQ